MADLFSYTLQQLDDLEGERIALPSFKTEDAWKLGSFARETLVDKFPNKAIVIDITTASRQVLFRTITKSGATPDNDQWVKRKINTVYRFGRSSFNVGQQMRLKKKTLEEARFVPPSEYIDHGGCVPIRLENSDVIVATLTLSGLAQDQDHLMACEILSQFKKQT